MSCCLRLSTAIKLVCLYAWRPCSLRNDARELDLVIGPEKNGFLVASTIVFRPPGNGKPRRKRSRIGFVPSQGPGIYVERSAGNNNAAGLVHRLIRIEHVDRKSSLPYQCVAWAPGESSVCVCALAWAAINEKKPTVHGRPVIVPRKTRTNG